MTVTATLLVILSASIHAGWNLFSKSRSPTIGFFTLATWGTILWFSPVLLITWKLIPAISFTLWTILLGAGFFQAVYYTGLARAYERGALSIAYPLARSLPLLILLALTFAIGRGEDLSVSAVIGILAIVIGAVILPMNHFRDFRIHHYNNPSCACAVVAAIGTAGYSFADDIGMHLLKQVSGSAEDWARALLYLILECVFTVFWLHLLMLFDVRSADALKNDRHRLLKPALLTGLAIGATYGIILLAMTHAVNVSYVIGLRQLSIPIGTLLGVLLLKEKGSLPRFIGVGILFIGLFLVATG